MPITPNIPFPAPRRRSPSPPEDDHPPTVRVPVPDFVTPPHDPAMTPPPRNKVRAELLSTIEQAAAARMPEPGEELFGFTLVEELGRGSFARVYLATQQSLAGRHVAVKVTLRPTREPDRLAKLQHTNVVPVYSVHEAGALQVVCMPFLGRTTAGHLLGAYRNEHPSRQQPGRRTAHTLKPGSTATSSLGGSGAIAAVGPRQAGPTGLQVPLVGDVPAVLKLVAALASGLAHAHARHVLHLDIKPANVLLAESGEPMLLDFNLAYDTTAHRDMVGGTVQYMAPEQLLDLRTKGRGGIDARTDLYSLGVLTYELLTGTVPFPAAGRLAGFDELMAARHQPFVPASESNPAVTPAVDAILAKLLAPEPADRYQTADAVRTDVERHLANLPLLVAREPVGERLKKWRRRHPGAAAQVLAACLAAVVAAGGITIQRQAADEARVKATEQIREARSALPRVRLDLILTDDAAATRRGKDDAAALLAKYNLPGDADWRKADAFARLPADEQARAAGDLGEVMLLLAHATWRDAKRQPEPDRRTAAFDALTLNRAAAACFDAPPPFCGRQQAELAAACGLDAVPPPAAEPLTPRDHFLDAVEVFAASRHAAAAEKLEKVLAADPGHAAAHLCLAACRHNLGQYARAVERYDAARVLMPADPRPYFYSGLALGQADKPHLAEAEFTKAIDRDPRHREAYRNRALARRRLGDLAAAEEDLTKGLSFDGPTFQYHHLRANVRKFRGNPDGAREDLAAADAQKPETERDYVVRGWARYDEGRYDEALADYRKATELNPVSAYGLRMLANLLGDKIRTPDLDGALAASGRLIAAHPDMAVGHAGRAVLLARAGNRAEAVRAAERARALSEEPVVTFTAACAYAVTGRTAPADLDTAMKLLKQAFRDGHRRLKEYEEDRDLDALRGRADFQNFLRAARELGR